MKMLVVALKGIVAFAVFAMLTLALMFIVIGSVMCMYSIVTDLRPTDMEYVALVAAVLLGGSVGLGLQLCQDE